MTLKLDTPIIEWQENRPDNKPKIISPFSLSGPVWFVVKLTRNNVLGRYDIGSNEWIANGIYSDSEVGWFMELPTSTFDSIPQEVSCLLISDIMGSDGDYALVADLAYNYQNIMPHNYLMNGNKGFHAWLTEECPDLKNVEFTHDHEHGCAYYYFKSEEQAFKFAGTVNKFLGERIANSNLSLVCRQTQ